MVGTSDAVDRPLVDAEVGSTGPPLEDWEVAAAVGGTLLLLVVWLWGPCEALTDWLDGLGAEGVP